ncbi:FG-GAP-like repeat-containing protein [Nonomuraea fuscirosea]|uniref:FG-GAP-like repeat-containing protein n=1 Tax=Nonomuraea fuscirosea TaxID=1291556 RepID=UPI0033ECFB7E
MKQHTAFLSRTLRSMLAVPVVALGVVALSATQASAVSRPAIVAAAQDQLGNSARNHESPMGSGCNYYTGYFRTWKPAGGCPSSDGVQWRDSDWCADFVKYVWQRARVPHANVPETGGGILTGWAASFKDYGVKYGTWHTRGSGYTPQPGDSVVFDWDQSGDIDHVGIVSSANGSTVYTIEGNSGDRIKANSYSRSNIDIVGYSAPVGGTSEEPRDGNSVTGDPYADLLTVDSAGKLMLYSNNFVRDNGQPYTGSEPREVGHGWGGFARTMPADVTGDGFTDLLAVNSAGKLMLYSNNIVRDDGQPYAGSEPREVGHGWGGFSNVIPADVTGDGFTDLLTVDTAGKLMLYSNNFVRDNGQPFTGSEPREVGHGWGGFSKVIPADVTGDGFTDLLALDSAGKLMLYSNNFVRDDGQPFTGSEPREVGHGWGGFSKVIPADVTGDGFTDLLALDSAGKLMLYSNNFVRDNGQPYTGSEPREVGHGWGGFAQILA